MKESIFEGSQRFEKFSPGRGSPKEKHAARVLNTSAQPRSPPLSPPTYPPTSAHPLLRFRPDQQASGAFAGSEFIAKVQ